MTSSAERIQQLLADKATLTAENIRLKSFAEAMFEHFEYEDPWTQCPYCLWSEGEGTHDCALETYAASRGDE